MKLPKEHEMPPRDKYTVFSAKAVGYRKGIHKVPKWTRVLLSFSLYPYFIINIMSDNSEDKPPWLLERTNQNRTTFIFPLLSPVKIPSRLSIPRNTSSLISGISKRDRFLVSRADTSRNTCVKAGSANASEL